ncbi:unnamed protein product [Amoebophrya sp. A120]|nr:unnamed protein product [Amoebophrya sp. A120]|eukprot:GSA120T00017253001.1
MSLSLGNNLHPRAKVDVWFASLRKHLFVAVALLFGSGIVAFLVVSLLQAFDQPRHAVPILGFERKSGNHVPLRESVYTTTTQVGGSGTTATSPSAEAPPGVVPLQPSSVATTASQDMTAIPGNNAALVKGSSGATSSMTQNSVARTSSTASTDRTVQTTKTESATVATAGLQVTPWFAEKSKTMSGGLPNTSSAGTAVSSGATATSSGSTAAPPAVLGSSSSSSSVLTSPATSVQSANTQPGGAGVPLLSSQNSRQKESALDPTHDARENAFERIYKHNLWSPEGSGSGPGSRVDATVGLREHLHSVIKSRNINIMLDIPCGAMEWTVVFLNEVWAYNKDFQYIGVDIAQTPLVRAKARFSAEKNEKNLQLMQADLSLRSPANAGILEKINAALTTAEGRIKGKETNAVALTRDALQHLSLKSACQFVMNIRDATVGKNHQLDTWLIGHYPRGGNTQGAIDGGLIDNNMASWPYKLGQPKAVLQERGYLPRGAPTKNLAVFRPWEDWKAADFNSCVSFLRKLFGRSADVGELHDVGRSVVKEVEGHARKNTPVVPALAAAIVPPPPQ